MVVEMVGVRRKARTVALQTLYELDCSAHQPNAALARLLHEKALPDEAADFARSLVNGVQQNKKISMMLSGGSPRLFPSTR
jgi:transcription termination factor NusB